MQAIALLRFWREGLILGILAWGAFEHLESGRFKAERDTYRSQVVAAQHAGRAQELHYAAVQRDQERRNAELETRTLAAEKSAAASADDLTGRLRAYEARLGACRAAGQSQAAPASGSAAGASGGAQGARQSPDPVETALEAVIRAAKHDLPICEACQAWAENVRCN
jgi:hypothetical protein